MQHPVTSRSWTTRMESVRRQFHKLMDEGNDDVTIRDAEGKKVDVVGIVRSLSGPPRYTVLPKGKSTGMYQTPGITAESE